MTSRASMDRVASRRSRTDAPVKIAGNDPGTKYSLRLPALWRSFKSQSLGFQLACFYLFIEYVRPQSIYPAIDIVPYSQIAILAGLAAAMHGDWKTPRARTAVPSFLALFALAVTLSAIFAYSPAYSLQEWNHFVPWLLAYALITTTVTSRERWFLFILLFLLFSFKMSQHGFRTWAGRGFRSAEWGVVGAPGYFRNAGEVGIQMCIFLPLAIVFAKRLWSNHGLLGRVFLAAMPITAAGTTIATNSRGAVFGAVVALSWLLVPAGKRLKGLALLAAVLAIGYLVIPTEFLARFAEIGTDKTSQSRLTYWADGIEIFQQNLLTGIGFKNWVPYYAAHYEIAIGAGHEVAHNTAIEAAAELGLPGLIAFLSLVVLTFRINKRTRSEARRIGDAFSEQMAHALDAGMLGFLVGAQFVSVLYYPFLWISLALTVSLKTAVGRAVPKEA